jgi:hypothetical protein
MAILGEYKVGNISDKMFDASIQSGFNPYTGAELKPGEAEQLTAERNQQTEPKEGILSSIANLFFGKLAAAEPDMPIGQKFSNQFSVTQPSQFDLKGAQLFDPRNMMRGSVVEDVVDTPTREFGTIRAGQPELGIFASPAVQDVPIDLSELDYRETSEEEDAEAAALLEQAQQEERRSALDILRSFGQDVMNRPIISSILRGASGVAGGITGLAGLAGPSQSQRAFDAMTPGQRSFTSSLYGRQRDGAPGLLEGYNQVSAFGKGALGTLSDRLDTVRSTLARQGANASPTLQAREKALSDAINKTITIGERQAPKTKGGIRTDVEMSEGAETGGGGKIVCTMMNESYGFGNFRNKIWLRQSKDLAPEYQKGYHILFLPLVKMAKTNNIIKKVLEHIAVHRTIDIRQESRGKTHILGRLYRKVLEPICYWVGKYAKR